MVNNWIFIAKRPGGDLRTIRGVIEGGIWDFVSSKDSSIPVTPSYALRLRRNDNVLFYISDRDQNGYPIHRHKAFIAQATLNSDFEPEGFEHENEEDRTITNNFVRLRGVRFFDPDIEVQRPRDFGIGFGPAMIVPIDIKIFRRIFETT